MTRMKYQCPQPAIQRIERFKELWNYILGLSQRSLHLSGGVCCNICEEQSISVLKIAIGGFLPLCSGGYTVEVTYLSPNATETEVYDFFSHCGSIEYVEILRSGEYSRTAYVTFKDSYAVGTAVLLSGATIADQRVCITHWGGFMDESDTFSHSSRSSEGGRGSMASQTMLMVSTPSEAVTVAQDVVKTLISKGYILGKDAVIKAKAFDESNRVSSTAISKVAELSDRIGLTSRINTGMDVVRSVDERYHVTGMAKSAIYVAGTTAVVAASAVGEVAVAATNAVISSSYFSKGALWVSDALTRAAKAASDYANQGSQ